MRAVQCHEFSAVEDPSKEASSEQHQQEPNAKSPSRQFRPRSSPKRLRDVLTLDTVPIPRLDDSANNNSKNTVLIRVYYAGIQYPDALQAQGLYQIRPPFTVRAGYGCDGCHCASSS